MRNLELQVDTLMRLCTAETPSEAELAKQTLRQLMAHPQLTKQDPEYLVRQILLEMGTPDHLVGHPYVVEAVLMAVENRYYINNITFGLYPQIAAKFDTTASRVERGIRHLIELTWTRGDMDILCRFFGNTVNPDRGKPTNGEFIARLAHIVQQQLRQQAS